MEPTLSHTHRSYMLDTLLHSKRGEGKVVITIIIIIITIIT
jgi:hypothetical protein